MGGAPIRDAIDRDVVAARLDIVHCGVRVQLLVRDGGAALVVCIGGGPVGDAVPLHYAVLAAIQLGGGNGRGRWGWGVREPWERKGGEESRGKVGGVCVCRTRLKLTRVNMVFAWKGGKGGGGDGGAEGGGSGRRLG